MKLVVDWDERYPHLYLREWGSREYDYDPEYSGRPTIEAPTDLLDRYALALRALRVIEDEVRAIQG
jgi:hypothetical protein